MALSSMFRKSAPPAHPARTALEEHKRRGVELQRSIADKQALQAPLNAAIGRLSDLGQQLDVLAREEARRGTVAPEKAALQQSYKAAEAYVQRLRASDYGVTAADLHQQKAEHDAKTHGLVRDAAIEELLAMASEFRELEEQFRAFHKRVYARLGLLDPAYGFGTFGSLFISRPLDPSDPSKPHPAYARGPTDHYQAGLARDQELWAMDAAVDACKRELLAD
jgi:hypothetical protein